ncbi:MAG: Holliday junction resolvase RuvX [Chloroflexota bacterium]
MEKYLALDLGEKRIGIALTDGLKIAAHPHQVIPRKSRREDFETIKNIAQENDVVLIVVGLPKLMSGEEGEMAKWARSYGEDLSEKISISVKFWDETLTSEMAAASMAAQGYSRKKMKGKLDAVAAALILQSYLEAERENDLDILDTL